ncbi:hypothetical protein D3C81_1879100 [compost metagenome]
MGNRNTHLLLAIEDIKQEHHALFSVHGEEDRIHLRIGPDPDLNPVPAVQGGAFTGLVAALPEVLDDTVRHLRGRSREADDPCHASR